MVAIWLFVTLANNWYIYWRDGSKYDFWIAGLFGGILLIFLVGFTTMKQFQYSLPPQQVFRLSIKIAAIGIPFVMVLDILMLLLGGNFAQVSLTIFFHIILFLSLGLVVGAIQICRLSLEKFDTDEHSRLMSNETNLQASQAGVLPYRQRVFAIWAIIFLVTLCAFFILAPIVGHKYTANTGIGIAILLVGIVVGFSLFGITRYTNLLANPRINSIEGSVSLSADVIHGWYYTTQAYKLCCNGQEFFTDSRIWDEVTQGRDYRLWYSPVNRHVIAYEALQKRRHKRQSEKNSTWK